MAARPAATAASSRGDRLSFRPSARSAREPESSNHRTQLVRRSGKVARPVVTGSPQRGPRDARVAGCPARGRAGTAVKHRKTACSHLGNTVYQGMRVIARNTLAGFWDKHPEAKASLTRWYSLVRAAHWVSTDDVQK